MSFWTIIAEQAESRMNALLLRETWSHMASVSGFDPLCAALGRCFEDAVFLYVPDAVPVVPQQSIKRRLVARVFGRRSVQSPDYGVAPSPFVAARHEWAGRQVLEFAEQDRSAWIFLSAGENQYGWALSQAPADIRRRVVMVAHQPPAWYRLNWRDFGVLQGLGALICLSEEQAVFFESFCDSPVVRSRHGVCHDFFAPCGTEVGLGGEPRLLFVGGWLRDFGTLQAAMSEVWKKYPGVRLDCVVPREARNGTAVYLLARDPRVRWHAGISPESLRELYQGASLLFLPLLDSTANNAIVEAMACGLPVVTSDVGGVAEYLPVEGGARCIPRDAAHHALAVLEWLGNPTRRADASQPLRDVAVLRLDWTQIAAELAAELTDRFAANFTRGKKFRAAAKASD